VLLATGLVALEVEGPGAGTLFWAELSGRGLGKDVLGFGFCESCGLFVGWNLKVAI
jgi:hypothetical protein